MKPALRTNRPCQIILKSLEFSIVHDFYQNNICLLDNGIVDTHNNVHIITSAYCTGAANPARLLYTKLNRTGTKLIDNLTIATHEKKKEYYHCPAIFDPKVAIDSEDNIHITWYINDGGNRFSIWYEKIDPNGTVLIPAMKIAPEDEDDSSIPGFEIVPIIMLVVLTMVVYRGKGRDRKSG